MVTSVQAYLGHTASSGLDQHNKTNIAINESQKCFSFPVPIKVMFKLSSGLPRGFPCGSVVKNPPVKQETQVRFLGWEDLLEKEMATHSHILAWRIPWEEESGGRWSIGSQRVGHN